MESCRDAPHVARGGDFLVETRTRRARTYERKKNRPRWLVAEEQRSALASFFTGGIEYDTRVNLAEIELFTEDFRTFRRTFGVPAGWGTAVELKFRRLGRHRADGLYYPDQRVLVLDAASWCSFAHEFGHLLDYRGGAGGVTTAAFSCGKEFLPFHEILVRRMRDEGGDEPRLSGRRGRLSWKYFSSPLECFARAFEQCVSEAVPQPSTLVGDPEGYRRDPLFFREIPPGLAEYFAVVLGAGTRALDAPATVTAAAGSSGGGVPRSSDRPPRGGAGPSRRCRVSGRRCRPKAPSRRSWG